MNFEASILELVWDLLLIVCWTANHFHSALTDHTDTKGGKVPQAELGFV